MAARLRLCALFVTKYTLPERLVLIMEMLANVIRQDNDIIGIGYRE